MNEEANAGCAGFALIFAVAFTLNIKPMFLCILVYWSITPGGWCTASSQQPAVQQAHQQGTHLNLGSGQTVEAFIVASLWPTTMSI